MSDENASSLTGMEALGYAILRDQAHVFLDGCVVSIEAAREASYDRLDAISVRGEIKATGWLPGVLRIWENSSATPRAKRTTPSQRRDASREEYAAAAVLARRERALWDAENERLTAARFRPHSTVGFWRDKAVWTRAEALATLRPAAPTGVVNSDATRAAVGRAVLIAGGVRPLVDLDALRDLWTHAKREVAIIRHEVQLGQADRSLALLAAVPALLDELADLRARVLRYEAIQDAMRLTP